MSAVIDSIRGEFLRYKALAEGAIAQVSDAELIVPDPGGNNSIVAICWHISGNLRSRFTEFLTSDGEKPWRKREEEFEARAVARTELLAQWERGWAALLGSLGAITDSELGRTVLIRGQPLLVHEALHRSLAHTSYHVGQIVYAAHALRSDGWRYLSIPPGRSEEYNAHPGSEKPEAHAKHARAAQKRTSAHRPRARGRKPASVHREAADNSRTGTAGSRAPTTSTEELTPSSSVKAATILGSNWEPAQRRSSATAASGDRLAR